MNCVVTISLCCAETPIRFTIPLSDQTCKEGETVSFYCEVSEGNLSSRWFKCNKEIMPSESVSILSKEKVHSLRLTGTQLSDCSDYSVVIKNITSHAKLTVQGQCSFLVSFISV